MKIYLFHPENGVYLGEDFADDDMVKCGSYRIPDDATIVPPPRTGSGELAVFDAENGKWEIRQNLRKVSRSDNWQQTFTEYPEKNGVKFSVREISCTGGED